MTIIWHARLGKGANGCLHDADGQTPLHKALLQVKYFCRCTSCTHKSCRCSEEVHSSRPIKPLRLRVQGHAEVVGILKEAFPDALQPRDEHMLCGLMPDQAK